MTPRPYDPHALATASVSSLVLAHDPGARGVAPNYWTWSAASHQALADALLGAAADEIRELAASVAADPSSDLACRRLVAALVPALSPTGGPAWSAPLARLAQEVECSSRVLVHFGDGRAGPIDRPAARTLLAAISRRRRRPAARSIARSSSGASTISDRPRPLSSLGSATTSSYRATRGFLPLRAHTTAAADTWCRRRR